MSGNCEGSTRRQARCRPIGIRGESRSHIPVLQTLSCRLNTAMRRWIRAGQPGLLASLLLHVAFHQ